MMHTVGLRRYFLINLKTMDKLRIRNSMIKDWESPMCKLAFKARWFGTDEEKNLMSLDHVQAIRWGVYFEQLILGSGMGGKKIELTPTEIKSTKYPIVKSQAKEARRVLLTENDYPLIDSQVTLIGKINVEGLEIDIEGNIDAMFGHKGIPELNVDTKSTADAENEFGDYAWGRPETMDMGQMVMYRMLVFLNYNVIPKSRYYVADLTKLERVLYLEIDFMDSYIEEYKRRIRETFIGISQALNFEYWEPSNSYNNCKKCPLKDICKSAVLSPEVTVVVKS